MRSEHLVVSRIGREMRRNIHVQQVEGGSNKQGRLSVVPVTGAVITLGTQIRNEMLITFV
jgi:hypothetical protein